MIFWVVVVLLSLLAIGFAVWPLWRSARRLSPLVATIIVFTVALSIGMYDAVGRPGVPSGRSIAENGNLPPMDDVIASLEARLAEDPDDLSGWNMLGRTYSTMRNYEAAAETYEKIMELEGAQNAQTMVDLAIAIINRDQSPIEGRTASLIENALALDPSNQAALFYAGVASANRGDLDTAATRWEILLGLNPPPEVRSILEQNIAIWRGEAAPAVAAEPSAGTVEPEPEAADDAIVSARISLSEEAMAAITQNASVFIIARDPAAPTPPIAVVRRMLTDLPAVVSLSDAQSMVAGRNLSAFAEIELLARVSLSGGPAAQSGDWFGSMLVRPAESGSVMLTIDRQVP
ncbi:MAG: hypothetical protein QNJ11_09055 [Woeseiaceae bacterium]|nr:hypothetical protein [Woeseiaceae bacterium]